MEIITYVCLKVSDRISRNMYIMVLIYFTDLVQIKSEQCIILKTKDGGKVVMTNSDEIGLKEWSTSIQSAYKCSNELFSGLAKKAGKIYGADGTATTHTHTNSGNNVSSISGTTSSSTAAVSSTLTTGTSGCTTTSPQTTTSNLSSNATNNSQ